MEDLVVFCADVGSVRRGNFGWACSAVKETDVVDHDSSSPHDLAKAVVNELTAGRPVALGFECPLFVPVPEKVASLGAGRGGEGNRPWSAGAGAGSLATGLVQAAWVLRAVRSERPADHLHLDWSAFAADGDGLLIWEAFVSAKAKGKDHVDDASIAVAAFVDALPDPTGQAALTADGPLSLAAAVALWSGWRDDPADLRATTLVIRASEPGSA